LRQLKGMGISIAMDDFGTGYSSLSLLNSFPFDRIKIDKSFVDAAVNNVRAEAIIKTVIGLGAALNVPVLIEGVETQGQLKFAVETGCEEVQGYYLGRPLAVEVMDRFYADYKDELTAQNLAKSQKDSIQKLKRA
jgi:diguanylate cyclase